ncbi:adhesion G-protein coupled receptor V1-like isoform X2 [Motacilla alba alba]|uniref:adhesion G-protein coupled receptor V1-like isoform X2 n=1 Tax=Motacilla alba alba TaxID=1094192 RepID=UPI0018D5584D|nr:adhesion G-protein coupled receptor V1-like isoform X2 [Motacilla alba alba]
MGLYVFVVYFILHNQLCCPVKASYTVDMNGHATPGSAFFTHGSGLPAGGGEISKSTQNLISAMEEVPADWERASLQPVSQASAAFKQSTQIGNVFHSSGGCSTSSLVADEESQEFDDLIFALKTDYKNHQYKSCSLTSPFTQASKLCTGLLIMNEAYPDSCSTLSLNKHGQRFGLD